MKKPRPVGRRAAAEVRGDVRLRSGAYLRPLTARGGVRMEVVVLPAQDAIHANKNSNFGNFVKSTRKSLTPNDPESYTCIPNYSPISRGVPFNAVFTHDYRDVAGDHDDRGMR